MKLWTPLRASTVPCIRQTRSVVPVREGTGDGHKDISDRGVFRSESSEEPSDENCHWFYSRLHLHRDVLTVKMFLDMSQCPNYRALFSFYTINREGAGKKHACLVSHRGEKDSSSVM